MPPVPDNLKQTPFPKIEDDELPVPSEISDSEEESDKRKKYATKEDEDVAVFMAIANKMSIRSLMHLMQGHARALNLPSDYVETMAETVVSSGKPVRKIVKKFRFDEEDGSIKNHIHSIDSLKDFKDLWISGEEMNDIRYDAIQAVNYFRKYEPTYTEAVETIASSYRDKSPQAEMILEDAMRKIIQESFARGLEPHIVSLLSDRRTELVRAVLAEQKECRMCKDSYEITSQCLREQSLAYSEQSTFFADKIAECDHIEALKACLSPWNE
ncbi:hypothetical protein FisN_5Hh178 [Fistulifera solaris]|jgi:hypothetical protein|uniref:Uncharacterized protein n=1 Tax=Fistulifera solaris TaxID=1519565 RepID=A0A1Z5JSE6_FISSO|nr:hypothetical protein FisN_5Hh178 [Fistulifera solaris]|eukprot:GAX16806.1 hypothetical protein FisN_5Hh178 [Fistulifera solaris]